jgi:hypothetical protein
MSANSPRAITFLAVRTLVPSHELDPCTPARTPVPLAVAIAVTLRSSAGPLSAFTAVPVGDDTIATLSRSVAPARILTAVPSSVAVCRTSRSSPTAPDAYSSKAFRKLLLPSISTWLSRLFGADMVRGANTPLKMRRGRGSPSAP